MQNRESEAQNISVTDQSGQQDQQSSLLGNKKFKNTESLLRQQAEARTAVVQESFTIMVQIVDYGSCKKTKST